LKNKVNLKSNDNLIYDVLISRLLNYSQDININSSDISGNTAFSIICNHRDTFLFDNIIRHPKFDINSKNSKGVTCIDYITKEYNTIYEKLFGPVPKAASDEDIFEHIEKDDDTASFCSDDTPDDLLFTNKSTNVKKPLQFNRISPKSGRQNLMERCDYSLGALPTQCLPYSIHRYDDYGDGPVEDINEFDLKKFSILKYFYEKCMAIGK